MSAYNRRGRVLVVGTTRPQFAPVQRVIQAVCDLSYATDPAAVEVAVHSGQIDVIALDAHHDAAAILDTWVDLFAVDVPIIVYRAPDDAFIFHALERGVSECLSAAESETVVLARTAAMIRRSLREQLYRRAVQDMALTSQMQERFYRIVSHDIKGPLTNLRMAHYLLRDMFPKNAEAGEVLTNAEASLSEMQEMVRIFLDVGATQPGKLDLTIECLDALDIIRSVVKQYGLTAGRKGIKLTVEGGSAPLLADARMLTHIASNLVSNAIKFSPANTTVRLSVVEGQRRVLIKVSDEGPGVPAAERGELFQPFARLSNQPTAAESTSGLGLWIVKHLTEMQHGRVWASFPADGGSVFTVELPTCS